MEIYFSFLEYKALTAAESTNPDVLAARIMKFQKYYNANATTFDWRYSRAEINRFFRLLVGGQDLAISGCSHALRRLLALHFAKR